MAKLPVPLIHQAEGSADCGVACVAMLLKYYELDFSYEKIKQDIGVFDWGTVTPQLGVFLLQQGFQVEIVTLHPALFTLNSHFPTTEMLIKHFEGLQGNLKGKYDDEALKYFILFLRAGGTLKIKLPTIDDIEEEINAKRPLISMLTHWFLFNSNFAPRFTQHFNVITGVTKDSILVNDPDWGTPFGGEHQHPKDLYMYAIYASAYPSIDNACLLKVKKA